MRAASPGRECELLAEMDTVSVAALWLPAHSLCYSRCHASVQDHPFILDMLQVCQPHSLSGGFLFTVHGTLHDREKV